MDRQPATDGHWDNLFADFCDSGATDEEVMLFTADQPDAENPTHCTPMLRFLRVVKDAKFPRADRVRAEMVPKMNIN